MLRWTHAISQKMVVTNLKRILVKCEAPKERDNKNEIKKRVVRVLTWSQSVGCKSNESGLMQ